MFADRRPEIADRSAGRKHVLPDSRSPRCGLRMLSLAALALLLGCVPPPDPVVDRPELVREDVFEPPAPLPYEELPERTVMLASVSRDLPGRSEEDHRALMQQVFTDLLAILPSLIGPDPAGGFVQQLRVIDRSRRHLHVESPFFPTEATVDTGLRATFNALLVISQQRLYAADDVTERLLAEMRDRMLELNGVRGPIHRLVAAQATNDAVNVVQRMSTVLAAWLEGDPETPGPAEQPIEQPIEQPDEPQPPVEQ